MKTVCIIGAGNIGSRHLQGLKKINSPLLIEVVDQSNESLKIAKGRYEQISSKTKHNINFSNSINNLPKKIDLAVIATSSNVRGQIIKQLCSSSTIKYFILEKLLFQKSDDYFMIQKLFKKNKSKVWVNCSMRTIPFYANLKKYLKGQKIQYLVSGSQYGLVTNAIHYIDHIAYLTNCYDFTVDITSLDKRPIESKRPGFLELNGTLNVTFKDLSSGSFVCYSKGNSPVVVEIFSENFRCISKESEKTAWISQSDNWHWQEVNSQLLHQSEMTNRVAEEILNRGSCQLTPYDQSLKIHLQLLESLLIFLNKYSKKKYSLYPFT